MVAATFPVYRTTVDPVCGAGSLLIPLLRTSTQAGSTECEDHAKGANAESLLLRHAAKSDVPGVIDSAAGDGMVSGTTR